VPCRLTLGGRGNRNEEHKVSMAVTGIGGGGVEGAWASGGTPNGASTPGGQRPRPTLFDIDDLPATGAAYVARAIVHFR